jgi:hypothetical protein
MVGVNSSPATGHSSPQPGTQNGLSLPDCLQGAEKAPQGLSVSLEMAMAMHFGAGFAAKGIMRGRFANSRP